MFRLLVLVAAFAPILVFGLSNPQICRGGAPLPYAIRISNCATAPCVLPLGTIATLEFDFTAENGLTSGARAHVLAESLGMTGEYELSDAESNVCANMPQQCPLDAGEDATFTMRMAVDDYPITDFFLELLIFDAGVNVTCFRLPARTSH